MKAYTSGPVLALVLPLAFGPALAQEQAATSSIAPEAAPPSAPANLRVKDVTDWSRRAIRLRWDREIGAQLSGYEVHRGARPQGRFALVAQLPPVMDEYIDVLDEDVDAGADFYYRVHAVGAGGSRSPPARTAGPARTVRGPIARFQGATKAIFDWSRGWFMIVTLIICCSVVYFIYQARAGKELKTRKIAGLEAVDEAVGRATEMGRPCLYVPGIQDMNDIQTIAGITILSRVAKTATEFGARVEVPTSRALVMTTARETVQAAFLAAGRPDAYNEDLIYYVTDEQFGYVAYLSGLMVREKPAACFYMGAFYAESLILAETGNSIGAIQVAGTAMPAQLPFFVAACDYTLIGEEFFAASAYLSGSPEELGSLKGQDVGKVLVAVVLVVGCTLATLASITGADVFRDAVQFITESLLT